MMRLILRVETSVIEGTMAEHEANGQEHAIGRILMELILPAIGFGLSVGFATKDYPVSLITGLAISGTIFALYRLDRAFLRPRLEAVSRDWLKVGLEMTFSLLEHVLGALLALFVSSRLFGFRIVPSVAWVALVGMVIVFPIIHGTETALRYYRRLQDKERLEEQLRTLATQAELRALKAQINPHFLFNTLNTIAQLIHVNPARAEAIIERLAEMFRYVLAGSERGLVPLADELAFVESYLEIEHARFGERLRVNRHIAPHILNVPVPSLILQPLVENAVRHGQGQGGQIDLTIRVESQGSHVTCVVADRGPGMPSNHIVGQGPGFGLRSVDERLRKTYGDGYGLEIAANEPQGAVVTMRIPV
jgi:signal transduction histidine kinase